jgi:hypothetical protein
MKEVLKKALNLQKEWLFLKIHQDYFPEKA